ncbi:MULTISPECIES: hypothetical protein [Limnospira]|uniref:Isochorismatase n=1 Tax=Limnospira indica PCC 8005 TaxID=376219 RepID=A0A9P1KFG5_9CYAN|nr:hypothetical protein [Limnospira indica]RAQ42751.1 isochorismatase [Arthrospira sp. O9.13F]CDM94755.1 conserved hypothetical protein [Limnospira indica PCC 8005]
MNKLPIPVFFDSHKLEEVWKVPYQQREREARLWAQEHDIQPAARDTKRIGLLLIDVQNTFCLPGFELFVRGAVQDNQRLCEFIYRHLGVITGIIATLDTHTAMQIFHPIFWVNDSGEYPEPGRTITDEDIAKGRWRVNPTIAPNFRGWDEQTLAQHARYYTHQLTEGGRYPLTIWPYHGMVGGISHALVSGVEEALFFHNIARYSQTHLELKGQHPLTENYSALKPEVSVASNGVSIGNTNKGLIEQLLNFDLLFIAGQAKSHCVAWTVEDLLTEIQQRDRTLAQRVYVLEDCTSPVIVPGVVDFTEAAEAAFQRFSAAGINLVKSTDAIAL